MALCLEEGACLVVGGCSCFVVGVRVVVGSEEGSRRILHTAEEQEEEDLAVEE